MWGIMVKRINHLEDAEQSALFKALTRYYPNIRQLTFAIPNGGYRTPIEAKRLQSQGVTPGIPDIFCAFASNDYHGLFIEMKRPAIKGSPKGQISPSQRLMISSLSSQGYLVKVCYGAHEALNVILDYWNLTKG